MRAQTERSLDRRRCRAASDRCTRRGDRGRPPFRRLAAAQRQAGRARRQQGRRARDAPRASARPIALGLGDPVPISAEHGEGLAELYERLARSSPLPDRGSRPKGRAGRAGKPLAARDRRPAECRQIHPGQPPRRRGATADRARGRDNPRCDRRRMDWRGPADPARRYRRACAAGRGSRASSSSSRSADALRAIRFAETVVLVLDALQPLERQDLTIARLVAEEGRALVLAANKWDAVANGAAALKQLRDRVSMSLPQLQGVALVPVSGLTRQRARRTDDGGRRRRRGVEPARPDAGAQPLARRDAGAPSAAAGRRAPAAACAT